MNLPQTTVFSMNIIPYHSSKKTVWDDFVLEQSVNGTFLQTKNFLDYHPDGRFEDASFLLENEKGHLVAVVPGCTLMEEGKKVFFSHKGSTFGGIVISKKYYRSADVFQLIDAVEHYLTQENYDKLVLKQTSSLFSTENTDLLDYCLFQRGYGHYAELSTYVDLELCQEDILAQFSQSKRSCIRSKHCQNFIFRALVKEKEHESAYHLLSHNLKKFHATPVHTSEELYELVTSRLLKETEYFGVFEEDELLAMSLVFYVKDKIVHTQYLASGSEMVAKNAMMFLCYQLLKEYKERGYKKVSWGISTEQQGAEINLGLIRAKESYGSVYSNNRTYFKNVEKREEHDKNQ